MEHAARVPCAQLGSDTVLKMPKNGQPNGWPVAFPLLAQFAAEENQDKEEEEERGGGLS